MAPGSTVWGSVKMITVTTSRSGVRMPLAGFVTALRRVCLPGTERSEWPDFAKDFNDDSFGLEAAMVWL